MSGSPIRFAISFVALAFTLGAGTAQAQCNATQLCAAGANPCEITSACTIPAGATFDIGNRALVIKNKTLTIGAGDAPATITAGSILLEPGSRIVASGITGTFGTGGNVTLISHSTITVQSQGTSRSKIVVSGAFEAGYAELIADGNIVFNGSIEANTESPDGFGGGVEFTSTNGSIQIDGMGLEAIGGGRGENGASGGEIVLFANGNVTVNSILNASNGDCIACDITIDSASGNIVTNQTLNVGASGDLGDGGTVNLSAEGTVTVNGQVLGSARGSGGVEDGEAGTGGDADFFGAQGIAINANVTFEGSAPDGDGGTIDISSLGNVNLAGILNTQTSASFGFGGEIFVSGGGTVTNTNLIDAGGGFGGGFIELTADNQKVTIGGELNVDADLSNPFGTFGGNIDVRGCDVELLAGKRITVLGGGAYPRSTARLEASGLMTVRGTIRATTAVDLVHRGQTPVVTGTAVITPAPSIIFDGTLPCCVNCEQCGNGAIEAGEQCDDGNTAGGDCCSATCQYEPGFAPCITDDNVCTVDVCNATGVCLHVAGNAGTTCRASAGVCDTAEVCTGSSPTCPTDAKSTAECRAVAGDCDVAEVCNGVSNTCPADVVKTGGTTCRAAAGDCDVAEVCNGSSAACPANGFASSATQCRGAAGTCDVAENCTGSSATCPADAKRTTECRASAGDCDVAEFCNGVGNDCPADGFASAAVTCRGAAGDCDVAESCTGSSAACPADTKRTGECRASAGVCDVAESCDGVGNACPADGFASNTTPCRGAAGVCDLAETCSGSSAACPADVKRTDECRASVGDCDAAEVCDGVANDCPADAFAAPSVVCRGAAGDCDLAETCTGSSNACPADQKKTGECRAAASVCDVAESCNGTSNDCPADVVATAGTSCRAAGGVCDIAESCDGTSPLCPTDQKRTDECRAAAGDCDVAESCNGTANDCPADGFAAATVQCRGSAGACDVAETCTGSSAACPADLKSTSECRASSGQCDEAEVCDGFGDDCPADETAPDGTICDDGNACTPDETCTDGVCGGGTAIVCDACETCDESGGCIAAPQPACLIPTAVGAAQLQIKNNAADLKDQVSWKWSKGQATPVPAFGDPLATDDYALCIFDESSAEPSLLFRAIADAGGVCAGKPCWKTLGKVPAHKGYKFQDKELSPDGFDQLQLKAGDAGRASISAKLKGVNLSSRPFGMPGLPVALPLRVQLQSSNGQCWESTHSLASKNDAAQLSTKSE